MHQTSDRFSRHSFHRSGGSAWRLLTAAVLAEVSGLVLIGHGPAEHAGTAVRLVALLVFLPSFAVLISGMTLRGLSRQEADQQ